MLYGVFCHWQILHQSKSQATSRTLDMDSIITRSALLDALHHTRQLSDAIAALLQPEDQLLQSMPDASPTKWHLAHTSWFFETFILLPQLPGYQCFQPEFAYLFNSYYNHVGPQFLRPQRGLLSRPTVAEVQAYRQHVDQALMDYLQTTQADEATLALIQLGIQHEQQHQELMLTDIKHAFSFNPLYPALNHHQPRTTHATAMHWLHYAGGETVIGHQGGGFHYDNEQPAHRVLLTPFKLAQRLVSNGEYLQFMADGGYDNPLLWLADGWAWRQQQQNSQPLYWQQRDGEWWHYSLAGLRPLQPEEPVCHINYYEADAYTQWAGKRLPTESEWEAAARQQADGAHMHCGLDLAVLHPPALISADQHTLHQLFGSCWQWTRSAYGPYPGFRPVSGAVGEYNGKFMCNQLVLKGSSCATPVGHSRASYRNFFPAHAQWQFTGIRMADDA